MPPSMGKGAQPSTGEGAVDAAGTLRHTWDANGGIPVLVCERTRRILNVENSDVREAFLFFVDPVTS